MPTLLTELISALRAAARYNAAAEAPPAAVLWTDGARMWEPLVPRLRAELPLLTLGAYDPAARTGPGIWLRCMVARTLPEADWPESEIPILYLPGVSKHDLRAVDECPPHLQLVAELQYRGSLFVQRSGRDWTIEAFLCSADGGLAVELMRGDATREALVHALPRLADEDVSTLRAEAPITAAKLNALLNPDAARAILRWMNDPTADRAARTDGEWEAFRGLCRQDYGFDPQADGEMCAAGLLGGREGAWSAVWSRFVEAPQRYPALPALLRRARPAAPGDLFRDPSSWPQDNEAAEAGLRQELLSLAGGDPAAARERIARAEEQHAARRDWVWADLDMAPLACALQPLAALARHAAAPLAGATPEEIAAAYAGGAWRADAEAMQALTVGGAPEDRDAIVAAVEAVYRPWLEQAAMAFQRAVADHPLAAQPATGSDEWTDGSCWLFVDGLRFDAGQALAGALEQAGACVERQWRLAALPTVTATAKIDVSPVAAAFGPGPEFDTRALSDGARANVEILRRELGRAGFQVLREGENGDPTGKAWTEAGDLDSIGHNAGWKLARQIPGALAEIAARVLALLRAGWAEVRIVTDHGWILVPRGLPKAELPEHLTEARKGRCARMKPLAATEHQTVPWRWDGDVRIAVAPGIGCYVAGREYEHGGLSPQECVTPVLRVCAAGDSAAASIASVRWTGLRCRVQVAGAHPGITADIRGRAADPATSLAAGPRQVDANGAASLVVPDDSRQGEAAFVVVVDASGAVLAQQHTTIGG